MFLHSACPVIFRFCFNRRCRQLSVFSFYNMDLVSCMLHRPCLVDVDMSAVRTDHSLIGTKSCRNNGIVYLRSSYHKMNVSVSTSQMSLDLLCRPFAPFVQPIPAIAFLVCFYKRLQNSRMRPMIIVIVPSTHFEPLLFLYLFYFN